MSDDLPKTKLIAFADFPEDQSFTFKVSPVAGRMLSAEAVGGTLAQLAKVIKTANKEYVKGSIFLAVVGARLNEDGSFEADLVQLPIVHQRQRAQKGRA